ncbi:MAG: AAA family ATPase [Planctomycetaceae bacterium]
MSAVETASVSVVEQLSALKKQLGQVIRGKDDVIEHLIVALVAGEAVLIEDVPGVGKTTLAKALARLVDLSFGRVQCTPDLLPADIFGFSVLNPQDGTFAFRRGPIFNNILLVDEINRASPRTQSALLEAMAEKQVTIEGNQHSLPAPFLVLATQNPSGHAGTFSLPESQLDRFLFRLSMDYPDAVSEVELLFDQAETHPLENITAAISHDDLLECQSFTRAVRVEKCVAEYMVNIVRATRTDERVSLGCSPRGTLMLFRAAQARATVKGRDYVMPDDVQSIAPIVLGHRLVLQDARTVGREEAEQLVRDIMTQVDVPR